MPKLATMGEVVVIEVTPIFEIECTPFAFVICMPVEAFVVMTPDNAPSEVT